MGDLFLRREQWGQVGDGGLQCPCRAGGRRRGKSTNRSDRFWLSCFQGPETMWWEYKGGWVGVGEAGLGLWVGQFVSPLRISRGGRTRPSMSIVEISEDSVRPCLGRG